VESSLVFFAYNLPRSRLLLRVGYYPRRYLCARQKKSLFAKTDRENSNLQFRYPAAPCSFSIGDWDLLVLDPTA